MCTQIAGFAINNFRIKPYMYSLNIRSVRLVLVILLHPEVVGCFTILTIVQMPSVMLAGACPITYIRCRGLEAQLLTEESAQIVINGHTSQAAIDQSSSILINSPCSSQ
jgi:hypothetical protein